MAAKIEGLVEAPLHVVQALDQSLGEFALQEGRLIPVAGRPVAPMAQDGAVEDQQGIGGRHRRYVGRKQGGG
jgi:hypothetical protein